MSVSYSAYQPSGQLGSKLEHVIITFQKNEIPLFGRAVEVVGWQSIFIVILCTLKQNTPFFSHRLMDMHHYPFPVELIVKMNLHS